MLLYYGHLFVDGSRSFWVSLVIQGIMQHPTAINTPAPITREIRIKTTSPFHFLNYPSGQSINRSTIHEFSANLLTRVVYERPWEFLWLGTLLLGIKVQHLLRIIQKYPFSANIVPSTVLFSKLFGWKHPSG